MKALTLRLIEVEPNMTYIHYDILEDKKIIARLDVCIMSYQGRMKNCKVTKPQTFGDFEFTTYIPYDIPDDSPMDETSKKEMKFIEKKIREILQKKIKEYQQQIESL